MSRILLHGVTLTLLLAAAGCASTGTSAPSSEQSDRSSRNSNLLTAEEIRGAQMSTIYEVVDRLRPRWLQVRNVSSIGSGSSQIVVYLNTKYLGGPEVLREFQSSAVQEIRYLDGPRASATLQGYPDHAHVAGGIVLVTSPLGR